MERKYIKTFEQFINEQTMNEGEISQEAKDKVLKFLKDKKGKSLTDAEVHALADELKVNVHDMESYIYGFATKHLAESAASVGDMHKIIHDAGHEMPKNHEEHSKKFKEILAKEGKEAAAKYVASEMKGVDAKKVEQVIESVINESRSYGILFVTKDLKNILDYHHDYKEVPLKVGIDMTNYIMDDNEYGANLGIEEHPKLDIAWIKVPYSFNNNRAYRGTIVKQSSNLE